MKTAKTLFILAFAGFTFTAFAEVPRRPSFPSIPGYQVLLGDFHVHTTFSDDTTWPTVRVDEAFHDGTDVLSITDHLEPNLMRQIKAGNFDKENVDQNSSYNMAKPYGDKKGIIVIHGAELTKGKRLFPGHFNTHFINDGTSIIKAATEAASEIKDPVKREEAAIRAGLAEAKKQNAFIVWNHPDWERQAANGPSWRPIYQELLDKGMLNGIEVVNHDISEYIDPWAFHWAMEKNLTIVTGTDCHQPMFKIVDSEAGAYRAATLLFVKDKTEAGVREALESHRTLVYTDGCLYGREDLLTAIFKEMFEIYSVNNKNDFTISLKLINKSTMPIIFDKGKGDENLMYPFFNKLNAGEIRSFNVSSADYKSPISIENTTLNLVIKNFFTDIDKPLKVQVKLK